MGHPVLKSAKRYAVSTLKTTATLLLPPAPVRMTAEETSGGRQVRVTNLRLDKNTVWLILDGLYGQF